MNKLIPKMARTLPVHQQVEEYIRSLIVTGSLMPGARLPSNQSLAEATGTSVFTVQTALSKLSREGLIDRKQKIGTFVRGSKVNLRCAGIYFNNDLWSNPELSFYPSLYKELQTQLAGMGIKTKVWIDDRPNESQSVILPSIKRALDKGDIQAVIAPLTNAFDLKWLTKLPVTAFVTTQKHVRNRISYDWAQMMKASLEDLRDQGCRSVGLISSAPVADDPSVINSESIDFYKAFWDYANTLGLETCDAWIRSPRDYTSPKQHFGYQQFDALWDQPKRPQGLLVWPDHVVTGVLMSILKRHVLVPQELKLALHRNDRVPYTCPVPATFIEVKTEEVASALIRMIGSELQGIPTDPVHLKFVKLPAPAVDQPQLVQA